MSTDGQRQDLVWQGDDLVRTFVNEVRGGVPYAADQIDMMLRVVAARCAPLRRFADLGCGSAVLARALLARFPEAEAVLVDFSEPMLAEARRTLGDRLPRPPSSPPTWRCRHGSMPCGSGPRST